ncbi:MAG: hypothetical protein N3B11_02000, partial [Coriobacteriia bacterium]|nr:hypothetical protein [Coriobacteriia bacterium]
MARSSESDRIAVVEEALRALASASGAVRLYPPSSPIRDDAVRRAAEAMLAMVVEGPVRLVVDRERFLLDGVPVGAGRPATAALAEALHALQIGQVIVAPGLTQGEVGALLDVLSRDAREVRATGGARAALVEAGAQNLAVVEVSLRTSDQQGLAGVDLVTAPLGDIAQHLPAAAERWRSSSEDGDGLDEIASAVDGIEPAMRDLALTRIAQSLLHLDERSRIALVEAALTRTANGRPMEGMLAALAKMPPAALARLLRLVAEQRETGADSLLQEIPLPTQMLREVRALVQPVPAADPARGVPETVDVLTLAAEASPDESDQLVVESLVRQATPAAAAERALVACLEVFGRKRDAESLKAVAEAAVRSLRAGSVEHLREAIVAASAAVAAPDLAPQASAAVRDLAREVLDAAVRFDAEQR